MCYFGFLLKDLLFELAYLFPQHLFFFFRRQNKEKKIKLAQKEIFYEDHFRSIEKDFDNFKFNIALSEPLPEDNWDGYVGFIHQVVLDEYLSKHPSPEDIEYYLCGPPMMLAAVEKMLDDLGVDREMIRFDDFG